MQTTQAILVRQTFKLHSLAMFLAGTLGLSSTHAVEVADLIYLNVWGTVYEVSASGTVARGQMILSGSPRISHPFRWTQTGYQDIGTLGGSAAWATAMSSDGNVIVGNSRLVDGSLYPEHAFRWEQTTGMTDLGHLGGNYSIAADVSADGSVVVGSSFPSGSYVARAFRWTQSTGMVDLGALGGDFSMASQVSADGQIIAGIAATPPGVSHLFRWTAATGMVDLGTLTAAGSYQTITAMTPDGTVIVGQEDQRAFRWTSVTGMRDLGSLGAGTVSPRAVSRDGKVVVGNERDEYTWRAFRWTASTGMVDLGTFTPGGFGAYSSDVSADGNVIVGWATTVPWEEIRAFRWTQATGMQSVEEWLTDHGATIGPVTVEYANTTNANGSVVGGSLTDGRPYIARVGDFGNGLITIEDISDSLASTSQAVDSTLTTAGILIHGAHSRPMSRRVAAGNKTAWLAGDWGRDDHGQRNGSIGLAELGYGYNFGPAQLNIAIGKTWSNQAIVYGGDIDADGQYVIAESIIPVDEARDLYTTLGAYGHWGDANIERGYLNAGLPDYSKGDPDTHTWGVRARVDWENAFNLSRTALSPYADISYTDVRMDSYTETGGGFPASFDRREESATELRAGVNGALPFSNMAARLVLNLEAVHRFDAEGTRTSGEMLGLFGFDLDGQEYDQTWARGGIGVEGELGKGKASLMLNGTTEGEMPNVWLAASYQVTF